ncbi:MAG: WYL domain-containing protein [Clostridia bacterium]|nr:WYL domain-containing protein [Clostridia bacterium]
MPYQELIKNFSRVRAYLRQFYVYGFRSRSEFDEKSARSYDDERRRVESWLREYVSARRTPEGKNIYISVDSRRRSRDPLYRVWKTKSFTDGDITLHFLIFDVLYTPTAALTVTGILLGIDERLSAFPSAKTFDESTLRKKLEEYVREGLIVKEKKGRAVFYRRAQGTPLPEADALAFFSEAAPCGVIGSFLEDKTDERPEHFLFKHHYITQTADSEILCRVFEAISDRRELISVSRHRESLARVLPLRVYISVQGGRQYLAAYDFDMKRVVFQRIDLIESVAAGPVCGEFETYRRKLDGLAPHIWGVSLSGRALEHVDFTIRYEDDEPHIPLRLEREKRCGTVERLNANESRFSAGLYDAGELIPWMRTFIGRITEYHFSNPKREERFREDLERMYAQYGIGGDEE